MGFLLFLSLIDKLGRTDSHNSSNLNCPLLFRYWRYNSTWIRGVNYCCTKKPPSTAINFVRHGSRLHHPRDIWWDWLNLLEKCNSMPLPCIIDRKQQPRFWCEPRFLCYGGNVEQIGGAGHTFEIVVTVLSETHVTAQIAPWCWNGPSIWLCKPCDKADLSEKRGGCAAMGWRSLRPQIR